MEIVDAPKDDVGRVLHLHDAPVVAAERSESWTVTDDGGVQDGVKFGDVEVVGDQLGFLPVADGGKRVVEHLEVNLPGPEFGREPVVTVEIQLRPEGAPRRNAQVTKPENRVNEVEVVVNTLAGVVAEKRLAGDLVVPRLVRHARFHGGEDVNQTWMTTSLGDDLLDPILFTEALDLPNELDGHSGGGGYLIDVCANRISKGFGESRI